MTGNLALEPGGYALPPGEGWPLAGSESCAGSGRPGDLDELLV